MIVKFGNRKVKDTFSIPRFKDYRRYFVYTKESKTTARMIGFLTKHPKDMTTQFIMSHQGEVVTMKPDDKVRV